MEWGPQLRNQCRHSRPGALIGKMTWRQICVACTSPFDSLTAPPGPWAEHAGHGAPVNEDLCLQATCSPVLCSCAMPLCKVAGSPTCLLCGGANESLAHIQCRCPPLTKWQQSCGVACDADAWHGTIAVRDSPRGVGGLVEWRWRRQATHFSFIHY